MEIQIHPAAKLAAEWWAKRLQQIGDKAKFTQKLAELIHYALRDRGSLHISCDYDPDKFLIEALAAAGIECKGYMFSADGILPRKHSLDVFPDRLEPKEGYGNWTGPIPVPSPA